MRPALLVIAFCLFLSAPVSAQSHPQMFITAPREAVWAQMKADYDANTAAPATLGGQWYKYLLGMTATETDGAANVFLYHVTGTSSYATAAWAKIQTTFINQTDATLCSSDYLRFAWKQAWFYDWLYPALSAGDRTTYLNRLNVMNACVTASYRRSNDTDHEWSRYISAALWYATTGSYNTAASTHWGNAANQIGGYTQTSANGVTSMRNFIYDMFTSTAVGGEWSQGRRYNDYVHWNLLPGIDVINQIEGVDRFPEATSVYASMATAMLHQYVPGLSQPYDWGDSETPWVPVDVYRISTLQCMAGLTEGTAAGQKLQDFLIDYVALRGGFGAGSTFVGARPTALCAPLWNPYATASDYTAATTNHFASGMGFLYDRTSWDSSASYMVAHFPKAPAWKDRAVTPETGQAALAGIYDHPMNYHGDWQLWKNGKYAFGHPITYAGTSTDCRGTAGGPCLGGLPIVYFPIYEYRAENTDYRVDNTHNFAYIAATQGGSAQDSGGYSGLNNTFIQEHTKSIVWLKDKDVVIVFDRTNVKDPIATGIDKFHSTVQPWITARTAIARKQYFFNTPVSPTVTSNYIDWTYSTGESARIWNLLPTDLDKTIESQATTWPTYFQPGYWDANQPKYDVRVEPQTDRQWDTFLNVHHAYTSTPATVATVQDTTNGVDAALVTVGSANTLTAFNAVQGPDVPNPYLAAHNYGYYNTAGVASILDTVRFRDTGYELTFAAGANATKALLFDLDPGTVWTYKINAGTETALSVDANGIGIIDIATTGTVTLTILAGGAVPLPPVIVQTASLPSVAVDNSYNQTLAASGGDEGPYTWSVTAGALPTGLSLSGAGSITGTATVVNTFNFTVQACDSQPECGTRALSIIVTDVPLLSGSYDNGTVGTAYSDGISVTGGTAPYVYTLESGSICGGLSLAAATGVISGTPTTVETCSFGITVTDDDSLTDTQGYQISIGNAPVLPDLSVRAEPGYNAVVIHISTNGLKNDDTCDVDILEGDTVVFTNTTTTGKALRSISFTGLLPNKIFGVDAVCGQIHSDRVFFVTGSIPAAGTIDWKLEMKPHANLVARGVEKVSVVASNEEGGSDVTVTAQACSPSCTVTLALTRGVRYSIFYSWLDAGENQIASSKIGMLVAVP